MTLSKKERYIIERALTDYGRALENLVFMLNDKIENRELSPFSDDLIQEYQEKILDECFKKCNLIEVVASNYEIKNVALIHYDFAEEKSTFFIYPYPCK